jgi:hypothetical protein
MVSDEGASPTPVSPVNDESDSDRPYLLWSSFLEM